jgi:hypothetical protein
LQALRGAFTNNINKPPPIHGRLVRVRDKISHGARNPLSSLGWFYGRLNTGEGYIAAALSKILNIMIKIPTSQIYPISRYESRIFFIFLSLIFLLHCGSTNKKLIPTKASLYYIFLY